MHVGLCRITLRLPESHSLKEKRQAVRSATSRLRHQFNISVAEVEDNDLWQVVTLGVSCVSNDPRHANEVLSRVMNYLEQMRLDWELLDYQVEVVSGL